MPTDAPVRRARVRLWHEPRALRWAPPTDEPPHSFMFVTQIEIFPRALGLVRSATLRSWKNRRRRRSVRSTISSFQRRRRRRRRSRSMAISMLTPIQRYAAGSLFSFALRQAQIDQTRPSFPSSHDRNKTPPQSQPWTHPSRALLRSVFRFSPFFFSLAFFCCFDYGFKNVVG